jgi:hypothetical protein
MSKKRLEFICEFSKVTPTFINSSIRKIEKTNILYIEPHRVIIKNVTFWYLITQRMFMYTTKDI